MKLKLLQTAQRVPGVQSFVFEPLEPLSWKAGQYLHYVLHHEPTDDRGSDRWFTIAAAPFEKNVVITTRIAQEKGSSFKKALAALNIGDTIEISNITGSFIVDDPTKNYVFIAGGIGITPFYAILKDADHAGVLLRVTLLYANRDNNIPYRDELDAFAKTNPNLSIRYMIGKRIDEAAIRAAASEQENTLFYVSGPEPMVDSMGAMLKAMGVPDTAVKQDWFPGYPADM